MAYWVGFGLNGAACVEQYTIAHPILLYLYYILYYETLSSPLVLASSFMLLENHQTLKAIVSVHVFSSAKLFPHEGLPRWPENNSFQVVQAILSAGYEQFCFRPISAALPLENNGILGLRSVIG